MGLCGWQLGLGLRQERAFTRVAVLLLLVAALSLASASCSHDLDPQPAALQLYIEAWRNPEGALRVKLNSEEHVSALPATAARQPVVMVNGAEISGRWRGSVAQPGWLFEGAFPVHGDEAWVSWPDNSLRSASGRTAPEFLGAYVSIRDEARADRERVEWSDLPELAHGCGCHTADSGPPPALDRLSLLNTGPEREPAARWVVAGEPAASWLLFSLTEAHPLRKGPQMPPPWAEGGGVDADALLEALEDWIVSGAAAR